MKLGTGFAPFGRLRVPHARRKMDIQVFDRKFAGNEAGEEDVAGGYQHLIPNEKVPFHGKDTFHCIIEYNQQRWFRDIDYT